jgi:hypothetical protein
MIHQYLADNNNDLVGSVQSFSHLNIKTRGIHARQLAEELSEATEKVHC